MCSLALWAIPPYQDSLYHRHVEIKIVVDKTTKYLRRHSLPAPYQ